MGCEQKNKDFIHIRNLAFKYARYNEVKVQIYKEITYKGTVYKFEEVRDRDNIIMYIEP